MLPRHGTVEFDRGHPSSRIIYHMLILYCCFILVTMSFSVSVIGVPVSKEDSSTFQLENETTPLDWRSLNGSGNNLANSDWGSIGEEMPNITSLNFSNNFSSMAHSEFTNPREISNILCNESESSKSNCMKLQSAKYWVAMGENDIITSKWTVLRINQ